LRSFPPALQNDTHVWQSFDEALEIACVAQSVTQSVNSPIQAAIEVDERVGRPEFLV
jgi:hypothetical protein